MLAHEIRAAYRRHFEEHGHHVLPSASLVPASLDPSVLLTTAGMQPLKPYFLGLEQPPAVVVQLNPPAANPVGTQIDELNQALSTRH